jgi:alpha,alpha-trehalose phosphorylase
MRDEGETLAFAPRLPDGLTRLELHVLRRSHCLRVRIVSDSATYTLLDAGATLDIIHYGEQLSLVGGSPAERKIPPITNREPPQQPAGRVPRRRSPGSG